jgi:hypothetical protein
MPAHNPFDWDYMVTSMTRYSHVVRGYYKNAKAAREAFDRMTADNDLRNVLVFKRGDNGYFHPVSL